MSKNINLKQVMKVNRIKILFDFKLSWLLLLALLAACAQVPKQQLVSRTQTHMGTLIEVRVPEAQLPASEEVFQKFAELDQRLSTYKPHSEISRWNRGEKPRLHESTQRILQLAEQVKAKTYGAFDIRLGKKNGPLDLGGIGKGFAVDESKKVLQKHHVKAGLIAASGDIYCFHPCIVAVRDPLAKDRGIMANGRLKHGGYAISTSGHDWRKHIIAANSEGSFAGGEWVSLTLISKTLSNAELDAWATGLFAMPSEKSLETLRSKSDWDFLLVNEQEEIYVSARWVDQFVDWKFNEGKKERNIITVQTKKKN